MRYAFATAALCCLGLSLLASPAAAQGSRASSMAVTGQSAQGAEHEDDALRLQATASLSLVTRRFELVGPEDVELVAPYYRGLEVAVRAFPVAWFARSSAAAPLLFDLSFAKHATTTIAEVVVDGTAYDLEIPTRHDASYFGIGYAWEATRKITVTPRLGWRTTEFSLGYNEVLRSSFYRGIEIGTDAQFGLGTTPLSLAVGVAARPSVSLGSTALAFGDSARAYGVSGSLDLRYHAPFGLLAGAGARLESLRTQFTRSGNAGDSDATDLFQSFVVTLGYAL